MEVSRAMTKLQETCHALGRRLQRFVGLRSKPKRLELRLLPYGEADAILRDPGMGSWRIAKEEDHNRMIGYVFLERIEQPNRDS